MLIVPTLHVAHAGRGNANMTRLRHIRLCHLRRMVLMLTICLPMKIRLGIVNLGLVLVVIHHLLDIFLEWRYAGNSKISLFIYFPTL